MPVKVTKTWPALFNSRRRKMKKEKAPTLKIEYVSVNDITPAKYNPRKLSDKEYADLKQSMTSFGFVDPVVINQYPGRKGILIGGHQRVRVWRDMGNDQVPAIFVKLTEAKEKELNIRLNRAVGEWDWDILKDFFDKDDLMAWGFTEEELLLPDRTGSGKTSRVPGWMD
jgi:ParB-like chromosome segregation protein Spo0J